MSAPEATALKKRAVRATPEQIVALQAAYNSNKSWSGHDFEKLSSEIGLTSKWIKSWFLRVRKKERDEFAIAAKKREASAEPEGTAPPKKRGRVDRRQPHTELPTPVTDLPATDDSYIISSSKADPSIPAPNPRKSVASSSKLIPDFSWTSIPGAHSTTAAITAQHNPRHTLVAHAAPGDYVPRVNIPPPRISQQPQSSASRPQHVIYRHPPASGPMLLPRQSPLLENNNFTLQRVPAQVPPPNSWNTIPAHPPNDWSTTPASVNSIAYNSNSDALLVPWNQNSPAFYGKTPAYSTKFTATSVAVPHRDTSLFAGYQLPLPQTTLREYSSNKNAPIRGLQSPFDSPFPDESSKHTNSLISSSHLRSYMADHNTENDKSQASTIFNTPVDDQILFSSMLNLTPESPVKRTARESATPIVSVPPGDGSVFDMGKTPLKHLSVLQGGYHMGEGGAVRSMTVDEMYERLLTDDLATSDPFQAAMGLVFMSRTGLHWD